MARSESLLKVLQEVIALHGMLEPLKPLKKEDEERLWKKFRLEWNYNSNHIEGNTLTYQQTELLLIFDKTTGDKDMREYEEMKAHDVAVSLVKDYTKDKPRDLTEADIREWNKIILVRPFWGNAQTADGQATRKLIEPGVYKKEPNSVRLQNGEMFHYATPEETPAKMAELMAWFKRVTTEKKLHPVEIAAQLHYDFVRIHPFDDSNGRTSRLLMNYVLLKYDYPPVIIKSSDKKEYLNALNKADVGDLDAFIEYIARQLIWSIQLNIKAAKSESVEEVDDVDKEISVWKKSIQLREENHPKKSVEVIQYILKNSLIRLLEYFVEKQKQFDDAFLENNITVYTDHVGITLQHETDLQKHLFDKIDQYQKRNELSLTFNNEWKIIKRHRILKSENINEYQFESEIKITFTAIHYSLTVDNLFKSTKSYSEVLTGDEIKDAIKVSVSKIFDDIKRKTKKR